MYIGRYIYIYMYMHIHIYKKECVTNRSGEGSVRLASVSVFTQLSPSGLLRNVSLSGMQDEWPVHPG